MVLSALCTNRMPLTVHRSTLTYLLIAFHRDYLAGHCTIVLNGLPAQQFASFAQVDVSDLSLIGHWIQTACLPGSFLYSHLHTSYKSEVLQILSDQAFFLFLECVDV